MSAEVPNIERIFSLDPEEEAALQSLSMPSPRPIDVRSDIEYYTGQLLSVLNGDPERAEGGVWDYDGATIGWRAHSGTRYLGPPGHRQVPPPIEAQVQRSRHTLSFLQQLYAYHEQMDLQDQQSAVVQ
jgi:hypothetical protein